MPVGGTDLPFAGEVEAYIRGALRQKNPDRPLDTNVEFFTAILLDALKIPRQAFTPIFAVARAAGWTAHAREQQRGGTADKAEFGVYRADAGVRISSRAECSSSTLMVRSASARVSNHEARGPSFETRPYGRSSG